MENKSLFTLHNAKIFTFHLLLFIYYIPEECWIKSTECLYCCLGNPLLFVWRDSSGWRELEWCLHQKTHQPGLPETCHYCGYRYWPQEDGALTCHQSSKLGLVCLSPSLVPLQKPSLRPSLCQSNCLRASWTGLCPILLNSWSKRDWPASKGGETCLLYRLLTWRDK